MAKTFRETTVQLEPQEAYLLVRQAGNEIPKFNIFRDDPQAYVLAWKKGWGWTNPVDMTVAVLQGHPGQTLLRMEAGILALADPMGFTRKTLDQFEAHINNHVQAKMTGAPVAPPPKDNSGLVVNLVILAIFGGFMLFAALIVFFLLMTS